MNSKRKGKRGEREAAARLRELGFPGARRGQQYSGSPDSPDVVDAIPGVHLEIKYQERMSLWKAITQAWEDAGCVNPYADMHRKNRTDWVFIVPAEHLHAFVNAVYASRQRPVIDCALPSKP